MQMGATVSSTGTTSLSASLVGQNSDRQRHRALLLRFGHDPLLQVFGTLQLNFADQLRLLNKWNVMLQHAEVMNYDQFLLIFALPNDLVTQRVFMLLERDASLSGTLKLSHFILISHRLLVLDQQNALEAAFRILSRRGAIDFDAALSCLDPVDVRTFVLTRYKELDSEAVQVRTEQIMQTLDEDGSGAVQFTEFTQFAATNPVFLTM